MDVFEDLLVELKEENLLEETIALSPANGNGVVVAGVVSNGNGNGHKNGSSSKKRSGNHRHANIDESPRLDPSEQMSSLQFVEFVVSGSERMAGGAGLPFDELQVQKAIHRYKQASLDQESDEFLESASVLADTLRSWEEDLTKRDAALPVADLRRFAETANPPLSPQTLFALVRFYRKVPVSENSYLKFDFVLTRLFSKFVDGERREMLCSRADVVKHLSIRYAEWKMNAFSALQSDDPDVALICISFDDFAAEVSKASRISELVNAKLFDRLLEFKKSSGAMLFVPQVSAAAIDSNLTISQKLYDLVHAEAERGGLSRIADIDVDLVSNAIGRTFEVAESGNVAARPSTQDEFVSKPFSSRQDCEVKPKRGTSKRSGRSNLFGVNPWLLLATVLSVVISVGIYVWSEYSDEATTSSVSAKSFEIVDAELVPLVKTAKVSGDTLFMVVTLKFVELSPEKRKEVAQRVLKAAQEKGCKRVTVYDPQGKTIAFASADRTDLY